MDLRRIRWLVVVVLVVGCLALAGWLISNRHGYRPTGDRLYDRTARWHLNHSGFVSGPGYLQSIFHGSLTFGKQYSIDLTELQGWEGEFGEDPRYWEFMAQLPDLDLFLWMMAPRSYVRYSSTTAQNQQLMLNEKRRVMQFDAGGYSLFEIYTGVLAGESTTAAELETGITDLLEIMDEAIALDPDNSFFHYRKAFVLVDLGEWEEAWDEVRLGNAAPRNIKPLPFPRSYVWANRDSISGRGNRLAAAMIMSPTDTAEYIAYKERYKDVCCMVAWGAPLEMADDWVTCAHRFATMENQDHLGLQVAIINARDVLLDYVVQDCLDLTAEQRQEQLEISQALDRALAEVQQVENRRWPQNTCPFGAFTAGASGVTPADWDGYLELIDAVDRAREELSALDPPPLAAWGRGELAGVNVKTGK